MNPSLSGVAVFVVTGMKYGAMVRAVSLLTVASTWLLAVPSVFEVLSVLLFDVTEHPCNPDPIKITEITANDNVFRSMFIVDLYSVYDCCLIKIGIYSAKLPN